MSGFEEDINEDVNVKDSRKIKLTPTTKNQILTLVHELAEDLYKVTSRTGETLVQNISPNSVPSLTQGGAKVTRF